MTAYLEEEYNTLDEGFAFGKFDDDALYHRLRTKKQEEIDQVREQMADSEVEKSLEISQNTHNYWQLGTLEEKRKLQKMVFPDGIIIDNKNRVYLSSKVNSIFLAKSQFQRDSEGGNKKLPTKNDEESSLVAGVVLPGLRPSESIRGCFTSESLVRSAHNDLFPSMAFQASLRP